MDKIFTLDDRMTCFGFHTKKKSHAKRFGVMHIDDNGDAT